MPTTSFAPGALVDGLKRAWRDGTPPDVLGALRDHPELLRHRTLVVDLAYEEYCLREEAGRAPATDSFCRELPAFRSDVHEVIRGHRALFDHPELLERVEIRWPQSGEVFEGFRVVRELGRGAFARAYLALDPDTGDRPVVLKLSPGPSDEAQTLGPVRHPHVAEVFWARRISGVSAICMRFVGAATFRDVIAAAFETGTEPPTARTVLDAITAAGEGLPPPEPAPTLVAARGFYADAVAAIGARLAGALATLHARGIGHGDLKPSNVVLGPGGHPYLIDFNLAAGGGGSPRRYGGTLPYLAPERVRRVLGQTAEATPDRADVYSFGAVLYEALAGRVPYPPVESADPEALAADLLRQQLAGPPRPLAGVPGRLAQLVAECLAIDPARRPSAAEVQRGLDRFVGRRRRRARLAATAAAVAIVGSAVGWEASRANEGPPAEPVVAVAPPAPVSAVVAPVTADDFIERGLGRLDRDPNGAFLDFSQSFRRRPDGRALALMGYARTKSRSHADALGFYAQAIDRFGYRQAWVLNNRAHEILHAYPNDPTQLAAAAEDARAALAVAPDLIAAKYNSANANYLLRLDRQRKSLDDERVLDLIEQQLADVIDRHPNDLSLHMLMAEVLAVPAWADSDRLDRAVDHLKVAVALGRPAKSVASGPILRRAVQDPVRTARLNSPLPPRVPDPGDPGVAHPSDR